MIVIYFIKTPWKGICLLGNAGNSWLASQGQQLRGSLQKVSVQPWARPPPLAFPSSRLRGRLPGSSSAEHGRSAPLAGSGTVGRAVGAHPRSCTGEEAVPGAPRRIRTNVPPEFSLNCTTCLFLSVAIIKATYEGFAFICKPHQGRNRNGRLQMERVQAAPAGWSEGCRASPPPQPLPATCSGGWRAKRTPLKPPGSETTL